MPFLGFREIRGKVFFDIGGAELQEPGLHVLDRGRPARQTRISDYGFGISVNFLGLPLHFDFSRLLELQDQSSAASRRSSTSGHEF